VGGYDTPVADRPPMDLGDVELPANNRSGTKRDGTLQRCSVVRDGLLAYPMTQ
jgi:hypothetical protein